MICDLLIYNISRKQTHLSTSSWFLNADDTGMFYGVEELDNDHLLEAASVHSEMILQKNRTTFSLNRGWAFPHKVYFNGDECIMPLPVSYPSLPNSVLPLLYVGRMAIIIQVLIATFHQFI